MDSSLNGAVQLYQPKTSYRYRYPSGARGSTLPKYPRPSVIIDYQLSDSATSAIKLEILNDQNEVVNTYYSRGQRKKVAEEVVENIMLSCSLTLRIDPRWAHGSYSWHGPSCSVRRGMRREDWAKMRGSRK